MHPRLQGYLSRRRGVAPRPGALDKTIIGCARIIELENAVSASRHISVLEIKTKSSFFLDRKKP